MRCDLLTWKTFLRHPSAFYRSFMDFSKMWETTEISLFSDASKNKNLGFGATCNSSWMAEVWRVGYIEEFDPSIEYLELFGFLAAVIQWIHRFSNRRTVLFCDNISVVSMINQMTTSCPNCMILLKILILKGMTENIRIFAKHLRSQENKYADWLSRNRIELFKSRAGHLFDQDKTIVQKQIWPINKLWVKN